MTTPRDIITDAARDAGILAEGQVLSSEDANQAFTRFNRVLASYQQRKLNIYRLQDMSITSTGAQSYTVGPGGDFDTGTDQRPSRLHGAYERDLPTVGSSTVDDSLREINSREDYSRITNKTLVSPPTHYFYDPAFPLGNFFPWPIAASGSSELHILLKEPLTRFSNLSETILLPEEYELALQYILAENICVGYGFAVSQDLQRLVKGAKDTLKGANHRVSEMEMPDDLAQADGGYDIYSDS